MRMDFPSIGYAGIRNTKGLMIGCNIERNIRKKDKGIKNHPLKARTLLLEDNFFMQFFCFVNVISPHTP